MFGTIMSALASEVVPLLIAGFTTFLLPKITAYINAKTQNALLVRLADVMGRGAALAAANVASGKTRTMAGVVEDVLSYVRSSIPDTVAKLSPTQAKLGEMAKAAIVQQLGPDFIAKLAR